MLMICGLQVCCLHRLQLFCKHPLRGFTAGTVPDGRGPVSGQTIQIKFNSL